MAHNANLPSDDRDPDRRYVQTWLTSRDMRADTLYFPYMIFGSICSTLASFQHILWPSSYACWANLEFSNRPCLRLCLCSFQGSAYFTNITSDTFTGNTVDTLPCLLQTSVWPGCHQCSPECMLGFKNGSDVVAIPNAPEFFWNTPDVEDHYCALR
jgi:hypothetical protein